MFEFKKIINYIVKQGLSTIKNNSDNKDAVIDYVSIFCKNEDEFNNLVLVVEALGKEVDKETSKTGKIFFLNKPFETSAGFVSFIKIRKPDNTRPQRGAPDFKIKNYQQFKDKYLQSSGNFTLMIRKDYEMIEIKGVDVLVYIPSDAISNRMIK